jgi:hypothetical protein
LGYILGDFFTGHLVTLLLLLSCPKLLPSAAGRTTVISLAARKTEQPPHFLL